MPASELLTVEGWLARHPYLAPVARLRAEVDAVLAKLPSRAIAIPDWRDYAGDFAAGTPVLASESVAVDLAPAGESILGLVEGLGSSGLRDELRAHEVGPARLAAWLRGEDAFAPSSPGLLRFLGWTAAAAALAPLVRAFEAWRDDERWMRRYCPICGSPPSMGQLAGVDPGRIRFLSCGCCGTGWRTRRTPCPFCEADAHKLASLVVEGEAGLRIDWCESCRGYLKTYDGQGNEALLLADWSSLHLDVMALDRGLVRCAASLYELPV
jgi:FdhE protein